MSKFYEIHTEYISRDKRKIISLSERKKKYVANNLDLKEVAIYDTDDGSSKEYKECDKAVYIFGDENILYDDGRLIFIELKGSDVEHAIKQINRLTPG